MAEYHLTAEAFLAERRRLVQRFSVIAAALSVGSFCYSYWVLHGGLTAALLSAALLLGAMVFGYYRTSRQQRRLLASYRLLVEPDAISRFLANMPTLRFTSADITGIQEYVPGTLAITTADKYRAIYVPAQVSDRPGLLRELALFAPLTITASKTWAQKLMPLASIGMLGLMVLFYSVSNKVVSTLSGTLILAILAWSSWHLWRNKNLPPQTRRVIWFMPLVFFSILAGLIARLL